MSRTLKITSAQCSREISLTSITRFARIAATSRQVLVGKPGLGSADLVHDLHKARPDVSGRTNAEVPGNKGGCRVMR